ncbi:MAG: 6-phosphofructokinase [Oscillospiraceae bacterium]|jgi:6-phosphofructokinase 1|nr:6-phosphofructokinase [Oscillospiraceae bacterium]
MQKKRIGVLTSGGDAPGMNAAIRAIVRSAEIEGYEVYGIEKGYRGLIDGEMKKLESLLVTDIIHKGGTLLYSGRCEEFKMPEGRLKAKASCQKFGIDVLIVLGGDGSLEGAMKFSKLGIPCIGLPVTIDNDVVSSEYSIGFDSAVNTATEIIDKTRDTARSHGRCLIAEVMGRDSGNLALSVAVACGAAAVLIPEVDVVRSEEILIDNILERKSMGMHSSLVVVSEGCKNKHRIPDLIAGKVGCDVRMSVLGHVQRGGSPTAKDRVFASQVGEFAVRLIKRRLNRAVVVIGGNIVDIDLDEVLRPREGNTMDLYRLVNTISK